MRKIEGDQYKATLVKGGEMTEEICVAELGIYGTVFLDSNFEILLNEAVGCIIKTKPISVNEGGIVAGYAYIDNPISYEGTESDFATGTFNSS